MIVSFITLANLLLKNFEDCGYIQKNIVLNFSLIKAVFFFSFLFCFAVYKMVDSEYSMDIYKTAKISIGTVMRVPEMLAFVRGHFKIKKMCNKAVDNDPHSLEFVPEYLPAQHRHLGWHRLSQNPLQLVIYILLEGTYCLRRDPSSTYHQLDIIMNLLQQDRIRVVLIHSELCKCSISVELFWKIASLKIRET